MHEPLKYALSRVLNGLRVKHDVESGAPFTGDQNLSMDIVIRGSLQLLVGGIAQQRHTPRRHSRRTCLWTPLLPYSFVMAAKRTFPTEQRKQPQTNPGIVRGSPVARGAFHEWRGACGFSMRHASPPSLESHRTWCCASSDPGGIHQHCMRARTRLVEISPSSVSCTSVGNTVLCPAVYHSLHSGARFPSTLTRHSDFVVASMNPKTPLILSTPHAVNKELAWIDK